MAMTLILAPKSLPTPPREGIAGANAVFEDADDFQARYAALGRLQPWYFAVLGLLPPSAWALEAAAACEFVLTGVMGPGDLYPCAALIVCGRLQTLKRSTNGRCVNV